jgi:PBSX family phage terminase large subunit
VFDWKPISEKGMRSIRESTARLNIWEGAVRSSKTVCTLLRWIEFVNTAPPGPLMMVGKTERTLRRNMLGPLADMLGPKRFRTNYGEGEVHICGRPVYLAGANDERAQEKIQGVTLAGAIGDELSLWPESLFKMLLSRLSVDGSMFFGTTNPDSPFHWLKTDFLDRAGELDLRSWHFELADNLSLSRSYIDALTAEYTGLWRKRYILGLWVQAEGAIYDMFEESTHVRESKADVRNWYVGIDYGTSNPFHAIALALTAENKLHVAHEYRYDSAAAGRSKTDAEYAEAVKEWLTTHGIRPKFTFIDPSAASFIEACRRAQLEGIWGADNAVLDGIRRTARLMTAGRLTFSPDVPELTKELVSYVWDPKKQEKGEDAPLKANDHGCDALRYAVNGTTNVWGRWIHAD